MVAPSGSPVLDELAMQPLGRDAPGTSARVRGEAARPALCAGGVHSPRLTFSIRKRRSACGAVVVPALPGAAEAHVVGLAAVAELDAVHDAVCGRRAAQRSHARSGHQPWPRAQIEACIGTFLRCRVRGCWRTRRTMVSEGSEHCTVLAHRLALPWMSCTPAGKAAREGARARRRGLSGGGWCSRPAVASAARARATSKRSRAFGPSPRRTAPSLRALRVDPVAVDVRASARASPRRRGRGPRARRARLRSSSTTRAATASMSSSSSVMGSGVRPSRRRIRAAPSARLRGVRAYALRMAQVGRAFGALA